MASTSGANARMTVDLERQEVVRPNGEVVKFDLDPFRKHCLLNGLDDIQLTLQHEAAMDAFETAYRDEMSWLYR
jgi:3-isopropylmalate/(R)-2-methylmalate dehydratase small subunit